MEKGGGNLNDRGNAICTDINGNIYITGVAEPNATFGPYTLYTGWADIFIVKYDSNGNVIWAINEGSDIGQEGGYGICTDEFGNCYITGVFRGSAYFGGNSVVSNGGKDIFIAKYDTNGNVIWLRNAGGSEDDYSNGISIDSINNIYITGSSRSDSLYFGIYMINGTGFFIAKYDNNGNCIWVKKGDSEYSNEGLDIDVDESGNIYATGAFLDYIYFDTILVINPGGGFCPFLVKYDNNGNLLWAKSPDPITYSRGNSISAFHSGGCIITGYFQSSIYFESVNLTSYGDEDIFIARYDENGNILWAKNAGSNIRDRAFGITTDNYGNSYITGYFKDTAFFDSHTVTSNGFEDIFIAKYDSIGNALWAISSGGNADIPLGYDEQGNGITIDYFNNCYVTGTFKGTANFNPFSLSSNGYADVFVVKLNPIITGISIIEETNPKIKVFPNPFSDYTNIEAYIPENMNHAEILIYNLLGIVIKRYNLEQGYNSITVLKDDIGADGIYFYALKYNGQLLDISKMIINR